MLTTPPINHDLSGIILQRTESLRRFNVVHRRKQKRTSGEEMHFGVGTLSLSAVASRYFVFIVSRYIKMIHHRLFRERTQAHTHTYYATVN